MKVSLFLDNIHCDFEKRELWAEKVTIGRITSQYGNMTAVDNTDIIPLFEAVFKKYTDNRNLMFNIEIEG